ncbi:hypothetical protein D3C80_1627590 [compost metagenome]
MIIRNPKRFYVFFHIRMVADDHRNFRIQIAGLPLPEQLYQTMILLGYKNRQLFLLLQRVKVPLHLKLISDNGKIRSDTKQAIIQLLKIKFNPHEEHATLRVHCVLIKLNDVSSVHLQKLRYCCY